MKEKIINFKDLTESWELIEAREPNFTLLFLHFVTFLVIAAFAWVWFGKVDVVIKANGLVRPGQGVSVVKSIGEGYISKISYKEGQKVKKGSVLFSICNQLLTIRYNGTIKEKKRVLDEIEMLSSLEESIMARRSLFVTKQSTLESRYYNRFLAYSNKLEELETNFKETKKDLEIWKKLQDQISKNQLDKLMVKHHLAKLNLRKFENETLEELKKEEQDAKDRLVTINQSLIEIGERFKQNKLRAPINGIIQVVRDFNKGDFINNNIEVVRIIPEKSSSLKVELFVDNKDISEVKPGQKVYYQFNALPIGEYGVCHGRIRIVSADTVGNKYNYLIEGTLPISKLYNRKGKKASEIKSGMLCQGRIVIRKKRLFILILEKMGYKAKS